MRRALILCLFLAVSQCAGICETTTIFPPLQPLRSVPPQAANDNIVQTNNNEENTLAEQIPVNQNYQDISQIEQKLFGRNFVNQDISTRLSRIEKSLFARTNQNAPYAQRIDNIISNFNQMNRFPNISGSELSRIEYKVFKQNFSQFSSQQRIEKLEQQMFGAVQSGDYGSRYQALKMAVKAYNKPAKDPFAQTGWKGMAGSLLGGNSGCMTGFTPSINPYNPYPQYNSYNAYQDPFMSSYQPRSGVYSSSGVNRGVGGYSYNESFKDYGSGMGVKILD